MLPQNKLLDTFDPFQSSLNGMVLKEVAPTVGRNITCSSEVSTNCGTFTKDDVDTELAMSSKLLTLVLPN